VNWEVAAGKGRLKIIPQQRLQSNRVGLGARGSNVPLVFAQLCPSRFLSCANLLAGGSARFAEWQGRDPESVMADATYGNGEFLQWLMERKITQYMRTRDSALRKNSPYYGPERFTAKLRERRRPEDYVVLAFQSR
jgi:hypothetical protein